MKRIALLLPILFAISLMTQGTVTGAEDFYKGKTIRLIVGNSTGGAMDDWGRFVALYLGKHIPGNPDVVVQNMPGAGAIIAANYIYNVAKPDGLTLGVVNPANYIDQLLGSKEVKFDWPKFSWIGSPERVDQVLFMRTDVAYKTHRRVARGERSAALRGIGARRSGLSAASAPRRRAWREAQHGARLWRRRRYEPGHRERRGAMPRRHGLGLRRPRTDAHLDQERFRPRSDSKRDKALSETSRHADDLRVDGAIQNGGYDETVGESGAVLG